MQAIAARNRQVEQELLVLEAQLPRLQAEEEKARAAVSDCEAALESLDSGNYGGFAARKLESARQDLRRAQQWHDRARAEIEKSQRRRERLRLLQ